MIEAQALWVKALLFKECKLPSDEEMMKQITRFAENAKKWKSQKPTMVQPASYIEQVVLHHVNQGVKNEERSTGITDQLEQIIHMLLTRPR